MRRVWCAAAVGLVVGLSGCGGDGGDGGGDGDGGGSGAEELTSSQDVAARIPGCADSIEDTEPELTAPELVDSAAACRYKGERIVIEVYLDDGGFDQVLDRVSIDAVRGMAFVHAGRWSVRVPPDLADDLNDALGGDAEVLTP